MVCTYTVYSHGLCDRHGGLDVAWILYQRMITPPFYILTISDMLATFGVFMAMLIAIGIFINITIYLREKVIHVKIVMATALMAITRKVIIIDVEELDAMYLFAISAVALSMSVGYWLIHQLPRQSHLDE